MAKPKAAAVDTEEGCLVLTEGDVADDVPAFLNSQSLRVSDQVTGISSTVEDVKAFRVTQDDGDSLPAEQVRVFLKAKHDWELVAPEYFGEFS
ncbi:unnamed protein product [marine sediment metagenome]|uniref:Uncharacterized protein n=1 Tax=marine sediment metagenome TaxID=412755 RepID=X1HUR5_9ZZZZ